MVLLNIGTEDIGVSSSQFEDVTVTVTTSGTSDAGELKVCFKKKKKKSFGKLLYLIFSGRLVRTWHAALPFKKNLHSAVNRRSEKYDNAKIFNGINSDHDDLCSLFLFDDKQNSMVDGHNCFILL